MGRGRGAGGQPQQLPRVRQDPQDLDAADRARVPDHPELQTTAARKSSTCPVSTLRHDADAGMGKHAGGPRGGRAREGMLHLHRVRRGHRAAPSASDAAARRGSGEADNRKMNAVPPQLLHLWSAYSVLQSWERIARDWLNAKGDPASRADVPQRSRSAAPTGRSARRRPGKMLRDRGSNEAQEREPFPPASPI